MLSQLPILTAPNWLTFASVGSVIEERVPLNDVLRDSLFYPASWTHGDPVKYLAGNVLSFVYVDYSLTEKRAVNAIGNHGFRGYKSIAIRSLQEEEFSSKGWPALPMEEMRVTGRNAFSGVEAPFCLWSVFERDSTFPPVHGPSRFSLLVVCADGLATFRSLYVGNELSPMAISVMRPGIAFGGNWDDYQEPQSTLARAVRSNRHGLPTLLLDDSANTQGSNPRPCWPEYCELVCRLERYNAWTSAPQFAVWRRPLGCQLI